MKYPQTIHSMIRDARCAKGITQSRLAELVGCRQSAVSMFESGRADSLSRKTLTLIAGQLGLDIKSLSDVDVRPAAARSLLLKYCPVDECPSNVPFAVRNRIQFVPSMVEAPASELTRCSLCGDVLEALCPNVDCRAELNEGAYCLECGQPYVAFTREVQAEPERWAAEIRRSIAELRSLSHTRNFVRRNWGIGASGVGHDQQKLGGSNHVEATT